MRNVMIGAPAKRRRKVQVALCTRKDGRLLSRSRGRAGDALVPGGGLCHGKHTVPRGGAPGRDGQKKGRVYVTGTCRTPDICHGSRR